MSEERKGDHVIEAVWTGDTELADPRPESGPDDEELARRLREEDEGSAAFDALVGRYHRRVWGLCRRMAGTPQESEDLVQETFLRLHRFRHKYRDGGNLRAWLDRICINVCLTHRERGRRRVAVTRYEPVAVPAPAGSAEESRQDPEARARLAEILNQLDRALETVPAVYRAALVLRAFGELTYPEIARTLGCSEGTVMSRIHRARERLRERLRSLR